MFSLSQYIIIGLVGSIYTAGTVFLLTGRSFLQSSSLSPGDTAEDWATTPKVDEESPYFFPVIEKGTLNDVGGTETVGPTGPFPPGREKQARTSYGDSSRDRRAVAHESEKEELVLLTTPICLN